MPGILTIAATPIGNPQDASQRLVSALGDSRVIAAEDTRRLRRLAADLGVEISGHVVSFFDGNEARRTQEILDQLRDGHDVLLVSDAGMPTVSDPGHRLVRDCAAEGITVKVLPGPSAVLSALAVSGLATDQFCFEGFLPRKPGERRKRLRTLAGDPRTSVFFESPRRVGPTLTDLAAIWGAEREAVVCRELTKTHEEVVRATLGELAEGLADGVLGEVTIVVAGAPAGTAGVPLPELRELVAGHVAAGATKRDAIDLVAADTGVPRRIVYEAAHASGSTG